MIFDWDENKEKRNIKNHDRIDFEEAGRAIQDDFALEEYDDAHSTAEEKRYACIGEGNRILYVIYTIRNEESFGEVCRIISARLAEPNEKKIYEREKFNSGYFG